MSPRPVVLAHRGASGYEMENTIPAFRRAIAMGADGVELDVHATHDGAIVVHHDPVIAGLGPIRELSAAAVHGHSLAGEHSVPTLAEALDAIGNHDVWVEIKALPAAHDHELRSTLRTGPAPERYGVHSFDHRLVRRIGEGAPEIRTGVLLAARLINPVATMRAASASVVWQEWSMIDADLVAAVHEAGGQVTAWTVNERAAAEQLSSLDVDALCGNHPDRLLRL